MNELILKLSEFEIIKIIEKNNNNFEKIDYCCDEIQACFLNQKEQSFCIGENSVGLFFESLITRLKKAIDEKLQLHESLTQNLGVLYNEYNQELAYDNHNISRFFQVPTLSGKSTYWVGKKYHIWSTYIPTSPNIATWLYNDQDGNIIFEVTRTYKWSFLPDDPECPEFVTYKEFMKNYKSVVRKIIPHDTAVEWLKQSMQVYRGFFSDEESFQDTLKKIGY